MILWVAMMLLPVVTIARLQNQKLWKNQPQRQVTQKKRRRNKGMIDHTSLFLGFCLVIMATRLSVSANWIRLLGFLHDAREILKIATVLFVLGFILVSMAIPQASFPKPAFGTEVVD
jgi:hypothetical protein